MQRDTGRDLSNAAVVSPRWVQWRERIDLDDYEARFQQMASSGQNPHGEADLIASLAAPGASVLDAGCGTGRIAIELDRRGFDVTGVDLDADMIEVARRKAPAMAWLVDDLARMQLPRRFEVVALPGNVMLFCRSGDRRLIVHNLAQHVLPGATLIAGFSLERDGYTLAEWDAHCTASGLTLAERFSTWDGVLYGGGDYHVSVHRRTSDFTVHDLLFEARAALNRVSATDLAGMLAVDDDDVVIVDTRQATDRATAGAIPGSVHLPRTVLEWRADPASGYSNPVLADRTRRIVVVCTDGYSSSLAAANLQRFGFARATDLIGGFVAWRNAGLAIDPEPALATEDDGCIAP